MPAADSDLTRQLFQNMAQRESRLALLASWRDRGLHGQQSIARVAQQAAAESGDVRLITASKTATHDLTISAIWSKSLRVAAALRELGVEPRDRVAVQLPNGPPAYATYLAVNALGAVLVPIVQIFGQAETQEVLSRCTPRAFVVARRSGGPELSWLSTVRRQTEVIAIGDGSPGWATPWGSLETFEGTVTTVAPNGDAPAALLYTSGTTGRPKGVIHTSSSLLAYLNVVPCPSFDFRGTFLWSWPSGHIGGLLAALSPFVRRLDTVLFGEDWDTTFLIDTIEHYRVAGMSGVPTVGQRLMDALEGRRESIRLQQFFTGGAFIPATLVERAEARGWHLTRSYGSTENPVATATVASDPIQARLYSEGRPVEGASVRILREDGSDCEPLEDGEVVLVSPQQMIGYDTPELNDEGFTSDGWLRTGDIGHLDGRGLLTITDRKKDIVIRGGENISSLEVERALLLLPAVMDAAVVAMPDPDLGERACAFLVVEAGAGLDLETIRSHFHSLGLARQKCPERIELVDEFPRTPTGKVIKKILRDGLRARLDGD